MTRVAERKTTMRTETSAISRGRALIVTIDPHDAIVRPKGLRHAYAVPWLAVYELGQKLAALEARKLKLEKRKR